MVVFIIQSPASASLSQSPVVYNVSSSTDLGQPEFQYKLDLYYWTGSLTNHHLLQITQLQNTQIHKM
mgnify:CR=1 FL=1